MLPPPCFHAGRAWRYGNPRTALTCHGNKALQRLVHENHVRTDNRYPLRAHDRDLPLLFGIAIPFATMTEQEWGRCNNRLKSLFAIGFKASSLWYASAFTRSVNNMIIADNLHSKWYSPWQPIPLSSCFSCSNPAHWRSRYSPRISGVSRAGWRFSERSGENTTRPWRDNPI